MKKLNEIKNLLSRNEMKEVQGGSAGGCISPPNMCITVGGPQCCTGSYCKKGLNGSHWGMCTKNKKDPVIEN